MEMKKIGMLAVLVIASALLFGCTTGEETSEDGSGRFVATLTDAAANIENVNEINVTVESVRAHSEGQGWITLSSEQQTYDLLELKAEESLAVLADINVSPDTYNQMELNISEVIVVDTNGEHEAKLPSGSIRINTDSEVDANSATTATFDVLADESLHITGEGTYILSPVIQFESRKNAQVQVQANNRATISGGQVRTQAKVGMDAQGNVGVGKKIPENAAVNIGQNGKVVVDVGGAGAGAGAGGDVCITLYDPVCGEDGETYSNSCYAEQANIEVAYEGECSEDANQTSGEASADANADANASPGNGPGTEVGAGVSASVGIDAEVGIDNLAYSQSSVTIEQGETVKWTNNDSVSHTVTSDSGAELESGTMAPGDTYSNTFSSTGTFEYHCEFHPSMTGEVVVE